MQRDRAGLPRLGQQALALGDMASVVELGQMQLALTKEKEQLPVQCDGELALRKKHFKALSRSHFTPIMLSIDPCLTPSSFTLGFTNS